VVSQATKRWIPAACVLGGTLILAIGLGVASMVAPGSDGNAAGNAGNTDTSKPSMPAFEYVELTRPESFSPPLTELSSGSVRVRIVDREDGVPADRVRVLQKGQSDVPTVRTYTNEEGYAILALPRAGQDLQLVIEDSAWVGAWTMTSEVQSGQLQTFLDGQPLDQNEPTTLLGDFLGIVTGQVLDGDRKGVADVVVAAARESMVGERLLAVTDSEGRFAFERVDGGTWIVSIPPESNEGFATASSPTHITVEARRRFLVQGLEFAVEATVPDSSVSGWGTASDGGVLTGTRFHVVLSSASAASRVAERTLPSRWSYVQGRWRYIAHVPSELTQHESKYDVVAEKSGYKFQRMPLRDFLSGPDVILQSGNLTLTVSVVHLKPGMEGFAYVQVSSSSELLWRSEYLREVPLNSSGVASVEGLFEGTALVEIRSSTIRITPTQQRVELTAAEPAEVEFRVDSHPMATLRIPRVGGAPVTSRVNVLIFGSQYPADGGGVGGLHTSPLVPRESGLLPIMLPDWGIHDALLWGADIPVQLVRLSPVKDVSHLILKEPIKRTLHLPDSVPEDEAGVVVLPGVWDAATAWRVFAERAFAVVPGNAGEQTVPGALLSSVRQAFELELPPDLARVTVVSTALGCHVANVSQEGQVELSLEELSTVRGRVELPEQVAAEAVRVLLSSTTKPDGSVMRTRVSMLGRLVPIAEDGEFEIRYVNVGSYSLTPVILDSEGRVRATVPGYQLPSRLFHIEKPGTYTAELR